MKATKEIKQELEDSIPTDDDLEWSHEQGCPDCNGHDITDWYEYKAKMKRRVRKIRVMSMSNKELPWIGIGQRRISWLMTKLKLKRGFY